MSPELNKYIRVYSLAPGKSKPRDALFHKGIYIQGRISKNRSYYAISRMCLNKYFLVQIEVCPPYKNMKEFHSVTP